MFGIVRKPSYTPPVNPSRFLSAWDPYRMMDSLLYGPRMPLAQRADGRPSEKRDFVPRCDAKETKDSFVIVVDLPGLSDGDVEISLTGNRLSISGKRETASVPAENGRAKDEATYFLRERQNSPGSFSRAFELPESADTDKVTAAMKDGVLTLVLPKRSQAQPRRVAIGKA
jgi:HSP20 family protein